MSFIKSGLNSLKHLSDSDSNPMDQLNKFVTHARNEVIGMRFRKASQRGNSQFDGSRYLAP
jgi:hypothetical protein